MGLGDEILASGQAKELHLRHHLPVLIVDRRNRPRWHEIWLGNPHITSQWNRQHVKLINASGARPYIAAKTATNWIWKSWEIKPGEIYLTDLERRFAEPYAGRILIEPNTKIGDSNKAWIWQRWQAVVDVVGADFIQVGGTGTRLLDNVRGVVTTFRQACAIMAVSRAFIGTEGGLHHAAAALGIPVVVLWSEFVDPSITGYASQRNLRHADRTCGSRVSCRTCRESMAAISVDEVVDNLREIV